MADCLSQVNAQYGTRCAGTAEVCTGWSIERKKAIERCMDAQFGPAVALGAGGSFYAARPRSASYQASIRDPRVRAQFGPLLQYIQANLPRGELFKGALTLAKIVSSIGASLTGFGAIYAAGSALSENVERSQTGMALNIGGILSAAGGILSGANLGQYDAFGDIIGGGLQLAGSALTPVASPVMGPVYGPPAPVNRPSVIPTAAGAVPMGAAIGSAIARVTAPILAKIAVKLGMRARPSLHRAMELVRKAGKILMSPEAVAAALGITVAELATLVVSSQQRRRRHMNPANAKALRRAARRIKSFHRLCTHTDLIKSRRRSSSSSGGCFKCGKRKCSC